ncbi:MAG: polysaccharide biosynthesis C-terminal domain-containing protein, partial [Oscillospiraceae bacterium]|nr:polysaccharide biosynthesis C-terminal domain-containing protein [Oscillospiraceae bacterium]
GVTDIKYCDIRLTFLFVVIALFTAIRTPGLQIINYAGYFKETLPQTIIETVINIVISIVTSFFWGIYGVLLGTLSALIYRYFDVISCSNKIILSRSPKKSFWVHLICVLVGLVTQFIYMLFSNQINTYFDFFIVGIMDFLFTGILMLIVCYIVFCDFRKTIKEIIRKKSTQV